MLVPAFIQPNEASPKTSVLCSYHVDAKAELDHIL